MVDEETGEETEVEVVVEPEVLVIQGETVDESAEMADGEIDDPKSEWFLHGIVMWIAWFLMGFIQIGSSRWFARYWRKAGYIHNISGGLITVLTLYSGIVAMYNTKGYLP